MPRGRPLKEDARHRLVRVRMTEEEYERLMQLSKDSDKTASEVIRDSVKLLYELAST